MNAKRAAGYEIPAVAILLFFVVVLSLLPVVSAQSSNYKVLFDETRLHEHYGPNDEGYYNQLSETAWYGGSDFADALKDEGYSVSTISYKPITYDKLKSYDIFVMLSNDDDYSDSEVDAIEEFVKTGGGLFLVRDAWGEKLASTDHATNKVAQRFGVSFAKNGNIYDATDQYRPGPACGGRIIISDIESHAVTNGISSFCIVDGTYIKDTGASKVLAYSDSDAWFDDAWYGPFGLDGNCEEDNDEISGPFPVLSVMDYGLGKIVFIGDGELFTNVWFLKASTNAWFLDDKQLGLNIVDWLAGRTTGAIKVRSDIILSIILLLAIFFTVFFVFRGRRKAEERRKQVDYEQKIADYKSKLEHWEKEGYDVSKLKEKWFK